MHIDQGVLSKHLIFGIQQYVISEFQIDREVLALGASAPDCP